MGKITGFIDYEKSPLLYRDPLERINDWKEIAILPNEQTLQQQAARCMDCAVPFCQDGSELAGMTTGCPIYNLIPEWNDLIFQGDWKAAYDRLSKTNPFPEFTGRACPAPCEGGCVASLVNDSVTIKNIELAIIDRAFVEGWVHPVPPQNRTGKTVAVIGSGPAGLTCASELNQHGHSVTVYERADRIGGLLTYGIPKMKIEQEVVERRVKLLADEGIIFIANTEIGKQISVETLRQQYDAVILCIGSTRPRELTIPGSDADGIHYAMNYLHLNTKSLLDSNFEDGNFITAEGKDVIIIGGGDTATDCVSTAIRQKCKSIVQFDIYPERPKVRSATNPWPQFPIVYKVDSGQEEAVKKFGIDPRAYSTSALEFIQDENFHVKGVKSTMMNSYTNEHGEKMREEVSGSKNSWSAQLVLLAIGFQGPETALLNEMDVQVNEKATIATDKDSYQTTVEGIFTAGDAHKGQSLIVWAIQEGKEAAAECHTYLMRRKA